jgi:CRISPR-associated exonuclease Cas4
MDDEGITISALQHFLYCDRQCALIHVERLWAESRSTAEGRILHTRTHEAGVENRPEVRIVRAMPLVNCALGIHGVADVVEFNGNAEDAVAFPVEYKRGQPKAHRADEVQLCAQALCLEEMLGSSVPAGAIFYGKTRRRMNVSFDDSLRRLAIDTIGRVKDMIAQQRTPPAVYEQRKCDVCSLVDLCLPSRTGGVRSARTWLARALRESVTPE